ncbi:MAG: enoyl-CoA hydratase/isomerase family protein [Acidimicrobiales bacterium]
MSSTFGDVTVTVSESAVAEVELHRPPANYFDATLLGQLVEAVAWADDAGCRAVVLCSEGRHFCAGLDFGRTEAPDADGLRAIYQHASALVASPLPLVAAVQGSAIGGGLGVAMVADFRVGSPTSRFSANFARLGFHQGFGLSLTLPRAIGSQRALELLTAGRRIGGDEAHRIGLCDVLDDDPRQGAHALAREIAASAPLAVRAIRSTLRRGLVDEFDAAVAHEREEQLRLVGTDDFREGIRASLERREPRFTGR